MIWGARIQDSYKGKVRVMAIMTGVQSAQVLGPTTQKQADKSRQSINQQNNTFDASANATPNKTSWESDGGKDEVERSNGLDVIR